MEPMQALADKQFRKDDDHIEAELEKQETYDSLKWAHSYTWIFGDDNSYKVQSSVAVVSLQWWASYVWSI